MAKTFISKNTDTSSNFGVFPAGPQKLQITKMEKLDTKAGDGSYLNLEMTIVKGEYKGRKVWLALNFDNPDPETVKYAKKFAMQMVEQIKGKKVDIGSMKELIKILKDATVDAFIKVKKDEKFGDKNVISYFIMKEDNSSSGNKSKDSDDDSSSAPPWAKGKDKKSKDKKGKKSKDADEPKKDKKSKKDKKKKKSE